METVTELKKENLNEIDMTGKITNSSIARVILGLSELSALNIPDFEINLSLAQTLSKLAFYEKAYNKTKGSLMNEHIMQDENGSFVVDGGKFFVFKTAKDKEIYTTEITKLNDIVIEGIDFRIKTSVLKELKGISAQTMFKINEFIIMD